MIEQAIIAICGVSATFLSQDGRPSVQRWACIMGLCAQPARFYTTWQAGQFGIFALSFFYTACWLRGVYNFWLKRAPS